MNLKQFAESRNIQLTKLKKLCNEILGTIPASLTDEQIVQIDAHLLSAAKALNPSTEEDTAGAIAPLGNTGIEQQPPTEIDQKVIDIIGVKELKENLLLYLKKAKERLELEKFKAESLIFQAEQHYYNDLANHQNKAQNESLQRMQRNTDVWHSEGLKNLRSTDNSEELDLHNELLELMESFGL